MRISKIISISAAVIISACLPLTASAQENMAGDTDGNGRIDAADIAVTASHIKGIKALDSSFQDQADVNADGNIDVTDISMIASHIKGIKPISQIDHDVRKKVAEMTLHEKVCQMCIVTPEGLTGDALVTQTDHKAKSALEQYPVGGLVYFSQNLESTSQTKAMINDVQQYNTEVSEIPLFISVDEEGGIVARCADELGTTEFEPMYEYRSKGTDTAYNNAKTIASDIKALGFNLDFAPVADTWSNPDNTVIGTRAYSDDFGQTAELVASAVKGFNDGGVACTLKHFPGHGDTAEDSHYGTATSAKTLEQLDKEEYQAFRSGIAAGADMVMVGHINMTNVDNIPASLSPTMINGELRGKLGFNGLVITDSLMMGAVTDNYSAEEAAVKVVEAGGDILLMPADLSAAVDGLETAVKNGEISEQRINESVARILKVKKNRGILK